MITCPSCHHKEIEGALFCSECGAQLVTSDARVTQSISGMNPTDALITPGEVTDNDIPPRKDGETGLAVYLRLIDHHGQLISLTGQNEFTIGRVNEGQAILPDIDLSNYDAYALGVSRQHATLKIYEKQVAVMDMDSANGTRVNGQKIMPRIDIPINQGDVITLGKLRMQVIIRV